MQICRKLSSGEILLLNAISNIAKQGVYNFNKLTMYSTSAHEGIGLMTKASKLMYKGLFELYEGNLIDKNLLPKRVHSLESGVKLTPYFRLIQLGYDTCNFIEKYEE